MHIHKQWYIVQNNNGKYNKIEIRKWQEWIRKCNLKKKDIIQEENKKTENKRQEQPKEAVLCFCRRPSAPGRRAAETATTRLRPWVALLILIMLIVMIIMIIIIMIAIVSVTVSVIVETERVGVVLGWHFLPNATCLLRPHLSYALSAKDHHDLLHSSLLLKRTCVRQVVLDKWFPLNERSCVFGRR